MLTLEYWAKTWLPLIFQKLDIFDDLAYLADYKNLTTFQMGVQDRLSVFLPKNKKVIVFGGANILKEQVIELKEQLKTVPSSKTPLFIAADGSYSYLFESGLIPEFLFTDLDGGLEMVLNALNSGTTIFVLIHSDNLSLVESFIPLISLNQFRKNIYWCTQGIPQYDFINTLGFTDGDRAACFAIQNQIPTLLLGFELQGEVGIYSTQSKILSEQYLDKKRIKLSIARDILSELNLTKKLFTLSDKFAPGIEISLPNFLKLEN